VNAYYTKQLQSTPLGKVVFQFASTFNSSPETRFKILSEGRTNSQIALTKEEVTELKIEKLLDLTPVPIVGRMLWIYHELVLGPAMALVEHRGLSLGISPAEERHKDIADEFLDFWLAEPAYNERARAFYEAIIETLEAYSHTRIIYYVDQAISRRTELDPFEGLTIEDLKKDQHTVTTCIYQETNRLLLGKCRDAYIELAKMPQIRDGIGRMFFITPGQLITLFRPTVMMTNDYTAFHESFASPDPSHDLMHLVHTIFSTLVRETV